MYFPPNPHPLPTYPRHPGPTGYRIYEYCDGVEAGSRSGWRLAVGKAKMAGETKRDGYLIGFID